MPVHIEEMTSEVHATAGELPLSAAQLEKLVAMVIKRLETKQRDARTQDAATRLRPSVAPGGGNGDSNN